MSFSFRKHCVRRRVYVTARKGLVDCEGGLAHHKGLGILAFAKDAITAALLRNLRKRTQFLHNWRILG